MVSKIYESMVTNHYTYDLLGSSNHCCTTAALFRLSERSYRKVHTRLKTYNNLIAELIDESTVRLIEEARCWLLIDELTVGWLLIVDWWDSPRTNIPSLSRTYPLVFVRGGKLIVVEPGASLGQLFPPWVPLDAPRHSWLMTSMREPVRKQKTFIFDCI